MFSDRLRGVRKKEGLTQEETAKKLNIARTTYSGYERGQSEPDLKIMNKISDLFKVDLNWLLTGQSNNLSPYDEKLVDKFMSLKEEDQKYILDLMDRLDKK